MSRFGEINIGDTSEIHHLITIKDIEKFVELTGDDNKIHIDKSYALKTSFKKPVVHGMLSASFISTIIGTKIPGDGALWYSQTLDFLHPVRVGDTITIKAEVIGKIERLNAIELQTNIYNQDHQQVIQGKAKIKIIEQEQNDEMTNPEIVNTKKVALVIGGSGGIGSEVCLKLADLGFDVAIHYNTNEEKAQSIQERITAKERNTLVVKGDITNEEDVKTIVSKVTRRLGGINVVINCATVKLYNIKFDNIEWSEMQKHFNISILGNFNLAKALVPEMKIRKSGKFIFLTTQATENVPPNDWMPYVTSKAALNGFAKCLAVDMAPFNINVNLVSPGMTETDLIADIPEKSRMLLAAKTPLKRLAKASEVASVICFLSSEEANYITGETIRVNGGQIML